LGCLSLLGLLSLGALYKQDGHNKLNKPYKVIFL
jgi:hypothetical protein